MRSAVSLFLISRLKGSGMRCLIYRWKHFLPLDGVWKLSGSVFVGVAIWFVFIMVLLGLCFTLFKNFPKRAKTFTERVHQGIYHGKGYMYGHVSTFSEKK